MNVYVFVWVCAGVCVCVCVCVCAGVCVQVCRWTTRGFFCELAMQPLRFQEQETRYKERLSSGRV